GEQIQTLIAGLLVDRGKTQDAGRLGHRFDDQHPRENGLDGEMAREHLFIDGDVLASQNPSPFLELQHSVDQQHGIAMGQVTLDLLDPHAVKYRVWATCINTHEAILMKSYLPAFSTAWPCRRAAENARHCVATSGFPP